MSDTLDLLTLAEAHPYLGIAASDTTQDTQLAVYITAVSRRIDTLCGPVVVRTLTTEPHDGGKLYVDTLYRPISSVTTITEYDVAGNAQVLTADTVTTKNAAGYWIDDSVKYPRRIWRRNGGLNDFFPKGGEVEITYVAGRSVNTAGVDPLFKQGASIMLAQLWRREQGLGSEVFGQIDTVSGQPIPTFSVPKAVIELLAEELRPPGVA